MSPKLMLKKIKGLWSVRQMEPLRGWKLEKCLPLLAVSVITNRDHGKLIKKKQKPNYSIIRKHCNGFVAQSEYIIYIYCMFK